MEEITLSVLTGIFQNICWWCFIKYQSILLNNTVTIASVKNNRSIQILAVRVSHCTVANNCSMACQRAGITEEVNAM